MSSFHESEIPVIISRADAYGIDPADYGSLHGLGARLALWGAILAAEEARTAIAGGDEAAVNATLTAYTNYVRVAQGQPPINPAHED